MLKYILKRILIFIPTLLVITLLGFIISVNARVIRWNEWLVPHKVVAKAVHKALIRHRRKISGDPNSDLIFRFFTSP